MHTPPKQMNLRSFLDFASLPIRYRIPLLAVLVFVLPFFGLTWFLVSKNTQEIKYLHYEKRFIKLKHFSSELEVEIQKIISSTPAKKIDIGEIERIAPELYQKILQYEKNISSEESLLLPFHKEQQFLAQINPYSNFVSLYTLEKLERLLFSTDTLGTNEKIFLFDRFQNPFFSNLLEKNFQVPMHWVSTLAHAKIFNSTVDRTQELKYEGQSHLAIQTTIAPYGITIISVQPTEGLYYLLRSTSLEQVLLIIVVVLFSSIFFTILSYKTFLFLFTIQKVSGDLASTKLQNTFVNNFSGEPAKIIKNLEMVRKNMLNKANTDIAKLETENLNLMLITENINEAGALYDSQFAPIYKNKKYIEFLESSLSSEKIEQTILEIIKQSPLTNDGTSYFSYIQKISNTHTRYFEIKGLAVPKEKNRSSYILLFIRDISERVFAHLSAFRSAKMVQSLQKNVQTDRMSLENVLHKQLSVYSHSKQNDFPTFLLLNIDWKKWQMALRLIINLSAWNDQNTKHRDLEINIKPFEISKIFSYLKETVGVMFQYEDIHTTFLNTENITIESDEKILKLALIYFSIAFTDYTQTNRIRVFTTEKNNSFAIHFTTTNTIHKRLINRNKEKNDRQTSDQVKSPVLAAAILWLDRLSVRVYDHFNEDQYQVDLLF